MGDQASSKSSTREVSAYAALEFKDRTLYVQNFEILIGGKVHRKDKLDVDLGMSKSICRQHAKIFYQFEAERWEIEALGQTGAIVNGKRVETGKTCPLTGDDKLQIEHVRFSFLLPKAATTAQRLPKNKLDSFSTTGHGIQARGSVLASTQRCANASRNVAAQITTPIHNKKDLNDPGTTTSSVKGLATPKPSTKTKAKQVDQLSKDPISSARAKDSSQEVAQGMDCSVMADALPENSDSCSTSPISLNESLEVDMDEEHMEQENDSALQLTVQQQEKDRLHQERLARQTEEEERGLSLPAEEKDPNVIKRLQKQKPTASYATMIYNAITWHAKKKMTLAQIYSWIQIYHPYYRYALHTGWQNSIRHNLSSNKAFIKVSRTEDEPGKGSFWAIDQESEMLFEGGVFKKKPCTVNPPSTTSRDTPLVVVNGRLTLNPNYHAGVLEGKAEEVLNTLHGVMQKQLGPGHSPEKAWQLARIAALALGTQLRECAVSAGGPRQLPQPRSVVPSIHQSQVAAPDVPAGVSMSSGQTSQAPRTAVPVNSCVQRPIAGAVSELATSLTSTPPLKIAVITNQGPIATAKGKIAAHRAPNVPAGGSMNSCHTSQGPRPAIPATPCMQGSIAAAAGKLVASRVSTPSMNTAITTNQRPIATPKSIIAAHRLTMPLTSTGAMTGTKLPHIDSSLPQSRVVDSISDVAKGMANLKCASRAPAEESIESGMTSRCLPAGQVSESQITRPVLPKSS